MSKNVKLWIMSICSLLIGISGALITTATQVTLPGSVMTVSIIVGAVAGAILAWASAQSTVE